MVFLAAFGAVNRITSWRCLPSPNKAKTWSSTARMLVFSAMSVMSACCEFGHDEVVGGSVAKASVTTVERFEPLESVNLLTHICLDMTPCTVCV